MKGKRTNLLFLFTNYIKFNFHVAIWDSGGIAAVWEQTQLDTVTSAALPVDLTSRNQVLCFDVCSNRPGLQDLNLLLQ